MTADLRRAGLWSAGLASFFSLAYVVAQLAEWAGLLGSNGGPEASSTPLGLALLLTPSLLLGPSFVVLIVSLCQAAPVGRRVWGHSAVGFAAIYAALTGLVYFVQLTLVAPGLARGETTGLEPWLFTPFDSVLYAVDLLGYSFMSLASLFAAFAVAPEGRLARATRAALICNGLLLPFIALQMFFHPLIYVAALWAVTFPASSLLAFQLFRRLSVAADR